MPIIAKWRNLSNQLREAASTSFSPRTTVRGVYSIAVGFTPLSPASTKLTIAPDQILLGISADIIDDNVVSRGFAASFYVLPEAAGIFENLPLKLI